jgi:hypothetical protein
LESSQIVLLPSYTAPPATYFARLLSAQTVVIYDDEIYRKQSPRNHFEILTSNGRLMITFPVQKPWRNRRLREVKLDRNQKWISNHWKSIRTAYGKAPFFEIYADMFEDVIRQPPEMLIDLNMELLKLCMKGLNVSRQIRRYSELDSDTLLAWKNALQTDQAKSWDTELTRSGDDMSYNQLFGNEFVAGLSVLDLLFNYGPESVLYLSQS